MDLILFIQILFYIIAECSSFEDHVLTFIYYPHDIHIAPDALFSSLGARTLSKSKVRLKKNKLQFLFLPTNKLNGVIYKIFFYLETKVLGIYFIKLLVMYDKANALFLSKHEYVGIK